MKKISLLLAITALAGAASSQSVVYSNIPTTGTVGIVGSYGYTNNPATTYSAIAFDDYAISSTATSVSMTAFRWVGGATTAGARFYFDFFDTAQNFVTELSYVPSSTGYAVRPVGVTGGALIPANGFIQIGYSSTVTNSAAVFGSTNANTAGSSNVALGTFGGFTPQRNMAFEITGTVVQATPEPSAIAALGFGAIAVLRRRKRA